MEFETVYLKTWSFQFEDFAPGIGYVLVLLGLIYHIRKRQKRSQPWVGVAVFHYCGGLVFLLFWAVFLTSSMSWNFKVYESVRDKNYNVVEGIVKEFHPMPKEGHDYEHFTVNGIYFEYSDYSINGGFNQSHSHGGPIWGNGQEVRLCYMVRKKENVIIRVEVKRW